MCGRSLGSVPTQTVHGFAFPRTWLRPRTTVLGLKWGLMQAALFLTPLVLIGFLAPETPQLPTPVATYMALLPIVLAFFVGYVLRDIGDSVKALMLSQLFAWFLIAAVLAAFSDEFRTFLLSSNPSRAVGFDILVFTALGQFAIVVGIPACALGGYFGGKREQSKTTIMDDFLRTER